MTQQPWGRPTAPSRPAWPPPVQAGWPPPRGAGGVRPVPYGAGFPGAYPGGFGQPRPPRRRRSRIGSLFSMVLILLGILFLSSTVRGMLQPTPAPAEVPGRSGNPAGTGGVAYANEDYSPPPADQNPPGVPGPRSIDAAGSLTTRNPVYEFAVPAPTNCEMGQLDLDSASRAAMEQHFNELMACLMRVYDEPVTQAGFEMPRPPVTVYDRPIRTACGDFSEVNAAYCTGDQSIYYARPLLDAFPPQVSRTPYAAEMILAHEFGHAVQARTAILISEKVLEDRARSEAAALDLSRRTEVQADCLAGLYVGSVAQSQGLDAARVDQLGVLSYNLGDDVLSGQAGYSGGHGTGRARQEWFTRGVTSTSIGICNSFVVDSAEVR